MKRTWAGFTLVELMVTITVAGILAAIAVPSMQQIIINRSADRLAQELQVDLMYARNQAISLRQEVRIKPLTQNKWYQGWTLEQNDNNNTNIIIRQKGRIASPLAKTDEITSSQELQNGFSFDAQGRLKTGLALQVNAGTFYIRVPKCKGNRNRDIEILYLGQMRTVEHACP